MTFSWRVVLEQLPGDVQGEVLGVHHAPDKAEVVRQQVGALVHDEHAGGVELQSLLVLPGVEVVGGVGGDIEHGLVGDGALGADVWMTRQGVLPVAELLLVELRCTPPASPRLFCRCHRGTMELRVFHSFTVSHSGL